MNGHGNGDADAGTAMVPALSTTSRENCGLVATSGLGDRQRQAWNEMHERMERRRHEWNSQVDRMRTDFFKLKPPSSSAAIQSSTSPVAITAGVPVSTGNYDDQRGTPNINRVVLVEPSWSPATSRQQFQASFDLSEYSPEEIKVCTDGRKLIVSARHLQKDNQLSTTFSREFTRQIDIPRHVDVSHLRCTLTDNGTLVVDADAYTSSSPSALQTSLNSSSPSASLSSSTSASMCRPVVVQTDDVAIFRVSLSVSAEYAADELTVKTVDRRVIVEAEHNEKGPGRRAANRQFSREFQLPATVDPETVTAHVTDDGQLIIEAPLNPSSPSARVR